MAKETSFDSIEELSVTDELSLPCFSESLETTLKKGHSLSVQGTNVVRVPFGIRQSRKKRPERPERWATLVLPFHGIGSPTPPPQAA